MRSVIRALATSFALAFTLVACNGDVEDDQVPDETGEDTDADADPDEVGASGPFRLSWVLEYLSPEYALSGPFTCSGGANTTSYCNEDFDAALAAANAVDLADADPLFQEAEDILLGDLPIIPLWYGVNTSVWSDRVDNVLVDARTYVRVERIEVEDGRLTAHGCESDTLIPQHSREVCSGRVLGQLFSGLVEIDPDTNEPELLVAQSIDVNDTFDEYVITIRDDFTFHDGTPVTVESFVDAWNLGANPENGFRNVDYFQQIEGFAEVVGGEADTLSGVEIVDQRTIRVSLSTSFSPFIHKLSDTSFFPLPEVAFDDIDAFNDAPVGNGRYQMDGVWERGQQIALERFDDWPGDDPGIPEHITFSIYSDVATAYLDALAGTLDVLEQVPPERLGEVDDDFGDNVLRTPTSAFSFFGLPLYREEFDSLELRQALSLAIDRQEVIDVIFDGAQTPATAAIPPVLDAHRPGACDVCEFDPQRAQDLFEEAGGYDGPLTVYFNTGGGHEESSEAIANQWREVLGIEDVTFESLDFPQFIELLTSWNS